jgi:hypothetical protein
LKTVFQPQIPARAAPWRRDSHNALFWNRMNAAQKFESVFSDARN